MLRYGDYVCNVLMVTNTPCSCNTHEYNKAELDYYAILLAQCIHVTQPAACSPNAWLTHTSQYIPRRNIIFDTINKVLH